MSTINNKAKRLVDSGKVYRYAEVKGDKIEMTRHWRVIGDKDTYEVMWDGSKTSCTCQFKSLKDGLCSHIQAVIMAEGRNQYKIINIFTNEIIGDATGYKLTEEDLKEILPIWANLIKKYKLKHIAQGSKAGEKQEVFMKFQIFNGRPQVVFYYGKRHYIFELEKRGDDGLVALFDAITGIKGIDILQQISPEILDDFDEQEIIKRRWQLKARGR